MQRKPKAATSKRSSTRATASKPPPTAKETTKGAKRPVATRAKAASRPAHASKGATKRAPPTRDAPPRRATRTTAKGEAKSATPERLAEALRAGSLASVKQLLAAGADANALDPTEETPLLFLAIEHDDGRMAYELVAAMLDAGADPNACAGGSEWTALTCACAGVPDPDIVELLLSRGGEPNGKDAEATPLTRVLDSVEHTGGELRDGPLRAVRALLAAGADPDAPRDDGWTPLMLAAHAGSAEAVLALLDAGANPTRTKGEDIDAAAIARHRGHDSILEVLRSRGATDPDARAKRDVAAEWDAILAWLRAHAPRSLTYYSAGGASEAEISALERLLDARLPADLRAHLALYGSSNALPFREYEILNVERIVGTWTGLRRLAEQGTFDGRTPAELREDGRVRGVWWSSGFVPFAEDGGGNQYCVDLDPAERGARGQVVAWEIHGGPVGPLAGSFLDYLRAYREKLEAGRLVYDPDSGIFDEVVAPRAKRPGGAGGASSRKR